MLSRSNLPFAVHWIAESSKAIGLPTSQTRIHSRTTLPLAKNKTYQPTLARTKDILAETLDTKTEGQNWPINWSEYAPQGKFRDMISVFRASKMHLL